MTRLLAFLYQAEKVVLRGPCWAGGTIVGGPFVDLPPIRRQMYARIPVALALIPWICLACGWLAHRAIKPLPPPLPHDHIVILSEVLYTEFHSVNAPTLYRRRRERVSTWYILEAVVQSRRAARPASSRS